MKRHGMIAVFLKHQLTTEAKAEATKHDENSIKQGSNGNHKEPSPQNI